MRDNPLLMETVMSNETVRDLMIPLGEYAVVSQSASLRDALQILGRARASLAAEKHRPRAVLVVDDQDKVIGQVGHLEILRALEPKFNLSGDLDRLSRAGIGDREVESLLNHLNFWEGTVDDACVRAAGAAVTDLMQPISRSIDCNATVSEAIHRLLVWQSPRLLVTDKNKIVGVLRLADLIADITRRIHRLGEKDTDAG